MGTLILIRHGQNCVPTEDAPDIDLDTLTSDAESYLNTYADLLKSKSLNPSIVFYEDSKNQKIGPPISIKRCFKTVVPIRGKFNLKRFEAIKAERLFEELKGNEQETIVFCYMSEHLKLWPKILGEHYICNAAGYRDGKQKLTKDQVYMLYENFLVCSFSEDDVVRFSYEIPIGFIPVQRNRL